MKKRIFVTLLVVLMVFSSIITPAYAAEGETENTVTNEQNDLNRSVLSYSDYKKSYSDFKSGKNEILLQSEDASEYTGSSCNVTVENKENVTVLNPGEQLSWDIDITENSAFLLEIEYSILEGRGLDCEISTFIDGEIPFSEAENISLSRVFKDMDKIITDENGNQVLPDQEEVFVWQTVILRNASEFYDGELEYYFQNGQHKLTVMCVSESIAISGVRLCTKAQIPEYKDYIKNANQQNIVKNEVIIQQAEEPAYKSHSMIYATSDYSSPATVPSDPVKIRLNTIGQMNWKYSGQWVTWQLNAEKAGYYRLAFKYRQDFVRGMSSARTLKVNGEIPFKEAEFIYFDYDSGFENLTIGDKDGNDYLIWLNEGPNDITLEVRIGEISEALVEANSVVVDLNAMYRQIIMITGTQPDQLRDYYLDRELPEMIPTFEDCAKRLRSCVEKFNESNDVGGEVAFFEKLAAQLESFVKKPETVQKRLDNYKNNVSTLASTILSFKEQPLELDYIVAYGSDVKLESAKASIFETVIFKIKAFIGSFFEDYNAIGSQESGDKRETLSVWANGESTGRDQLALINKLIENRFIKEYDTNVALRLVGSVQILTQAVLAGAGPDVALIVPETAPVNLAMRGALTDLSTFDGFEEMTDWFYESAFIPYEYEGGIYGMPETQSFSMQFYRKDIFEELGISPPTTWDEFFVISSILQKNKLEIGIPENVGFFETLLLQNGKSYYNDSHTKTTLDSVEALDAFVMWTSFYKDYSYPLNFDAYNRFRTGEMPLVIMPTSFYNQLVVAAPEIKGKWGMVAIPGKMENGVINRTQSSVGTAAILLSDSRHQQKGFEFISWWVSESIQSEYGNQIEAQLGAAARYATANKNAFLNLPWTQNEQKLLSEQWESVSDMPIVPGEYYVSRNLSNAFRRVVYYSETPREVLNRYNSMINKEIMRKRKEYGLSVS